MQPHDPEPMAMQQHGGRTKIAPHEPYPLPVPARRLDEPEMQYAPRPEQVPDAA